jgi:signal transduction histidine kinase
MNEHEQVNILMVDDQPSKLLSYEVILSELGENLIKAGSGREALEHLLKTDIAVVLMDVSMPEIDGFELAELIRQHPRYQETAIIFISAVHMTDVDQLKGYARGAVDYIPVPVIPELLRAKVHVFADLYRKTRQLARFNAELEQRVAERTADLQRVNEDLRQVAYISAHDLQEPVRQVGVYTQKLAKRYGDTRETETVEAMDFIIEGTQRMAAQFNDLMRYLEVDERGQERAATDCEEILQRALETLREPMSASGATVTHDPLPTIEANAHQLQIIFHELLDNALKFRNNAPPCVHMWATRQEQSWRFAIRDNGIGIDPQFYGRLFGFFRRLDRQRYEGTGMGLAISKKIVERHGGRIWIEPTTGGGTTLFFTIGDKSSSQ